MFYVLGACSYACEIATLVPEMLSYHNLYQLLCKRQDCPITYIVNIAWPIRSLGKRL
jgi:hypothetical protein